MQEQTNIMHQKNEYMASIGAKGKRGRVVGSTNLHAKHESSIARRLKLAGLDWVVDLANAIKTDNLIRVNMWMRLLPYLIVTQGHRRPKRWKGKASKAAVKALEELEGRE